nr:MFS transporter [Paenibacillus sediminis]
MWSGDFVKICLSSFFVFLTFYTLATSLPVYVKDNFHGTGQQIGLTMTVFVIAAVLLRSFSGKWMAQYGERKVAVISLAAFFVVSAAYLNIAGMAMLLLLRFLHGGSFAIATTSTNALALRLIPENRKGEGISYFSLFMSLAMVIGPFVGLTITSHLSYGYLFGICAIFGLLALLFGMSTRAPKLPMAQKNVKEKFHWSQLIETKAIPIGLAGFVLAFAYSGLTSFISLYAKELSMGSLASYFFVFFGVMIVLPRPLIGKILDKYGEHVIVYPSIGTFTIGMLLLGLAHSPASFLLSGLVCGLGYGALLPCFQTIAVQAANVHRRAVAIATFFVLFDLGYGVGSYLLGVLASSSGYSAVYMISAIIVAFTAIIYFILHHKRNVNPAIEHGVE